MKTSKRKGRVVRIKSKKDTKEDPNRDTIKGQVRQVCLMIKPTKLMTSKIMKTIGKMGKLL